MLTSNRNKRQRRSGSSVRCASVARGDWHERRRRRRRRRHAPWWPQQLPRPRPESRHLTGSIQRRLRTWAAAQAAPEQSPRQCPSASICPRSRGASRNTGRSKLGPDKIAATLSETASKQAQQCLSNARKMTAGHLAGMTSAATENGEDSDFCTRERGPPAGQRNSRRAFTRLQRRRHNSSDYALEPRH